MFRLNDPILIPHRDFLRSFFLDQPISGPRPPDQLTHGPELVVVMHRAALGNKRSPVPAIAIARTPSRERLKEIPKKLSEGGRVLSPVHHGSPDRVSGRPRLSPALIMTQHSPPH